MSVSSAISGNSPRTFATHSGELSPHFLRRSSTQVRPINSGRRASGTSSAVKFGLSKASIRMTLKPDPGLQTLANSDDGSSGLPIARTRDASFVINVSAASHSALGMPQASSRTTSTAAAWMP